MPSQSVRFDSSGDRYTRTLSPTLGTTFTVVLWARLAVNRGNYSTFWGLDNGGQTDAIAFQTWNSPGNRLVVATNGGTDVEIHDMTVGTWYCYSFTRSALSGSSAIRVRYGTSPNSMTAVTSSPTGALATSTFNTLRMSHSGWGDEWVNGNIAFAKIYTRVLSDTEIAAELGQYNPSSTTGLYAAYSFWDGPSTTDLSGQGRTLTAGGTLTAESGPPDIPQTSGPPPGGVPADVFDLDNWKVTLPTGSPDADEVTQPALETYSDSHFYLNASNEMVFIAPVIGSTTSGSGATRCELREMQNGTEASWTPNDTEGVRQLTVSMRVDPTGASPRQETIIMQIHAGENPVLYLAAEWMSGGSPVTPRIRVFKDTSTGSTSGAGNMLSGLIDTTTEITLRIRYTPGTGGGQGRVGVYGAVGGVGNLTETEAFGWNTSEFFDVTGWYFKTGVYNKSEVNASGASGQASTTITYVELLQPGDEPTPQFPEPGRFLLAYA